MKLSHDTYFAARDAVDTASILEGKVNEWSNSIEMNGFLEKLRSCYTAYHGAYYNDTGTGHQITFGGEQGELVNMPVNQYRNIAQHMLVMTTSTRPSMECRATNTDAKSLKQTVLANNILDYYMREKKLETFLKQAVEYAIVYGAGHIAMRWNATSGQLVDYIEETKTKIYEGDIEFEAFSPFDVIMDGTKESQINDWVMIRRWKNKYDLAAKYPEFSDKIKALQTKADLQKFRLGISTLLDTTDDIQVIEFFHDRTDCMPDGRYMMFLSSDIVVEDTALPYRRLPVYRIAPSNIHGTPYGYTPMFDILPLQEELNSLYSTVATNQNAFGVQNILNPRGSDIALNQLAGGLNIIDYNPESKGGGIPTALQLTNTPAEVFKFIQIIEQVMETISGVNSVARGNPEASLKSGTALALVQSMALQFMSGLQQSYVELIEDVGTGMIKIFQDFAHTPRLIAIAGKKYGSDMKEFNSDDISNISRVIVDIGNPMARCLAKNTPVMMFDGTIKLVQDVKIGDLVMGPDSSPRTVKNTNSGQETMYEVTSKDKNRAIKYGCNESHILTLKYCSDDSRYDVHQGDIVDISVKEFLKLTSREQRLLQGFTTGVHFEKKRISIPPYILGAWLGDGHSATTALTSMDTELVSEWSDYASTIGMQVRVQENRQPNKSKVYFITSGQSHGSSDRNPMMNELREMELLNNKHIPHNYLTSNRHDRLELLAGLLDTDGYRTAETFVFTQKNERLARDVVYLAKSVGLRVTCKQVKSGSSTLVGILDSEVFKIVIAGNNHEIPTRLPRKQVKYTEKSRDPLNYGINIENKGIGTYYGFTLEEEPHFLLGDFTVTHNTTAGRVQMAQELIQYNEITPQQYVNVIKTGSLDELTEDLVHENFLIRAENEDLLNGVSPIMSILDAHKEHIDGHRSLTFDTELRSDAKFMTAVQNHIQEHIQALRTTDPDLLMLLGQQPLHPPAPPAPPQGVPGPGGPPPGPPAPSQGHGIHPPGPGGPVPAMMMPPQGGQMGPQVQGGHIVGPGLPQGQRIPVPSKVPAAVLSNPMMQQQAMGNVRIY